MTSARADCAPPIWKRTQVQWLKESLPTAGGDEDQGLVLSEEVWMSSVIWSQRPC